MFGLIVLACFLVLFGCSDDSGGAVDGAPVGNDALLPTDSAVADARGVGADCGGFAGFTCDPGLVCDFAENDCGGSDSLGTCVEPPTGCGDPAMWVCGCDGMVYDGECEAFSAETDVSIYGGCTAPLDTFACGFRFCAANTQYCRRQVSDVGGFPDVFECVDIPASCTGMPDCACLAAESCGDMCEVRPVDGSLLLTCPGG